MINVVMEEEVTICHKKLSSTGDRKCIGSACMAWRGTSNDETVELPGGDWELKTTTTGEGYCGLAGKP